MSDNEKELYRAVCKFILEDLDFIDTTQSNNGKKTIEEIKIMISMRFPEIPAIDYEAMSLEMKQAMINRSSRIGQPLTKENVDSIVKELVPRFEEIDTIVSAFRKLERERKSC